MSEQLREAGYELLGNIDHATSCGAWKVGKDSQTHETIEAFRAALSTHHAAPGAPQQEVSGIQHCDSCNGHGMVGGLRPDGYDSQDCPFCKGTGLQVSCAAATAPAWDASQIKQPGWNHVQQAFVDGAREARTNPEATDADFTRASDGYTKRVFEAVDPVSEKALRTESWVATAPGAPQQEASGEECERCGEPRSAHTATYWCDNQSFRAAATAPAGQSVPVPTNEEQAALMVLLGTQWLEQHAPQRLKATTPANGVHEGYKAFLLDEFGPGLGQDRVQFSIGSVARAFNAGAALTTAARAADAELEKDAAQWREYASKLDALVTYCPTCCTGFTAKPEMTRDEVIFECGKTAGRSAARAAEPTAETVKDLMLRTTFADRPGANLWLSTSIEEKAIVLKVLKAYAASPTPPTGTSKEGGADHGR